MGARNAFAWTWVGEAPPLGDRRRPRSARDAMAAVGPVLGPEARLRRGRELAAARQGMVAARLAERQREARRVARLAAWDECDA